MKAIAIVLLACACLCAQAGVFTVTNTADGGPGSLRWAITNANALPDFDVITFNIQPAGGIKVISPSSALPRITNTVAIAGGTQPGYSNSPLIEVNGSLAGCVNGLEISAIG